MPLHTPAAPGNLGHIRMAVPLFERLAPPRRLIADKTYDADDLRRPRGRRIRVVILILSSAAPDRPYPLDRRAYRRRNLVERLVGRPKNWRRVATRYDRLARNYLATLALVAALTECT